jgi:CRISPR-associated endonuclease/helicase Cas3
MESYYRYWGKADEKYEGEPKWHPLVYHSLDVAAVAAVWWDACPVIRRILRYACDLEGVGEHQFRALVLFFVSLHDIGKFDVRFQYKASDRLEECWPELDFNDVDFSDSKGYDHGVKGYLLAHKEHLEWFAKDSDFSVLRPWFLAVTGHHGELPDISALGGPYPAAEDYVIKHDRESRCQFVDAMAKLFLEPVGIATVSLPFINKPAFTLLLAGFCSVADWIGSNADKDAFPYHKPTREAAQYYSAQLEHIQSRQLLTKFGIVRSSLPYAGVQSLLRQKHAPRGVQVRIDTLPVTPGLTLIEAPTGAGKTEAALAYAWQLLDAGIAESIVFALPTQATANAMLKRVEEFAGELFGENSVNVVLAHGKRDFNHEFKKLVNVGRKTTTQGNNDASVQCSEWLTQSRKRVFLGQIGVCTVDQVLLSVLPVKHKFVRGFGLNKSVLIVDEVHAYDSYMHGLLAEVVRRQRDTGGSAILLSATLPQMIRNEIVATWGGDGEASDTYPLITQVTAAGTFHLSLPKEHLPPKKEVQVECLSLPNAMPDEALLSRIVTAAETGCRVAIIANLVNDAQIIARLLRDPSRNPSFIPVDIFHARYRFIDRQEKETLALDEYGLDAKRGTGRILVATQVIEQSLDLDFDWMVTQICPVDLFFQRLGRLHRHERQRPTGFNMPRCTVMTVEEFAYGLHKEIYGNTRVLWRTETLLKKTETICFPFAYREWINAVYQRGDWDNEPDNIAMDFDAFNSLQNHRRADAQKLTTMTMSQFRDEDDRITSLTRDGEMSLTVVPMLPGGEFLDGIKPKMNDEQSYAEAINLNSIPVPASWGKHLHGCRKDDNGRFIMDFVPSEDSTGVSVVGGKKFRYSKDFGLEKE